MAMARLRLMRYWCCSPLTENSCFDLMEHLFQGQLVLRTRCLECECFTERREDFQDISVPVQEDEPCQLEDDSEGELPSPLN